MAPYREVHEGKIEHGTPRKKKEVPEGILHPTRGCMASRRS